MCFNTLNPIEIKQKLPIIAGLTTFFSMFKQINHVLTCEQGAAQYAHDFVDVPFHLDFVLDDGYQTIRDNCRVDLDSHRILTLAPKGFNLKMLLYKFEKYLNNPSIFIKKGNLFSAKIHIVSIENKCSIEFTDIYSYSAYWSWIMFSVVLVSETNGLVKEDIIVVIPVFHQVSIAYNPILWSTFLADDKEGLYLTDVEQTRQIPISSVKDIACLRFVLYIVHGIDIMQLSLGYKDESGNLCDDVNESMQFNACFCAPEVSPLEYAQTEVNCRRVECVELSTYLEPLVYPCVLGHGYHVHSKLLEDAAIPECIGFRKNTSIHGIDSKTQMIGLLPVSYGQIREFTKARTTLELAVYHYEHVVPMRKLPSLGVVWILFHDLIELVFRQEISNLRENVSSFRHRNEFWFGPNLLILM